MNIKIIFIVLTAGGLSIGGYYYYEHNYVDTLLLSEIVGHSENPVVNILVNLGDFDTGLTRYDIRQIESNKDYWINRIKEVEAIQDPDLKAQANTQLLSDMMEDPTMKKVYKNIISKGLGFTLDFMTALI